MLALTGCSLLFLITGMSGCASIPGATGEEQVQTIDELVNQHAAGPVQAGAGDPGKRSPIPLDTS